jgi:hypothetical protein
MKMQRLEEGMDERARALAQIDQRLADLYLSCILKDCDSYRSY